MEKRSLDRNSQGIRHYHSLKADLERKDERISISLPQFIRIMFFDKPNSWINEINRFDFIRLASLDNRFGQIETHSSLTVSYCSTVVPSSKEHLELSLDDMFNQHLLTIDKVNYSVIQFVWSICYNGAIHMIPNQKYLDTYHTIYERFLLPFPDAAYHLMFQLAEVLVNIFDEFQETLLGKSNAISSNRRFQPMIVKEGVYLHGHLFESAFFQIPIRHKKRKGIRVCLNIKIESLLKSNYILECGNRASSTLRFGLFQNDHLLILTAMTGIKTTVLKTDIKNEIGKYFNIEIAIYPDGKCVLAIDGILKDTNSLNENIEIPDGKLIIGCNLDASKFGVFYNQTLVIQSIEAIDQIRTLNVFGLKRLNIHTTSIAYNIVKRPFL